MTTVAGLACQVCGEVDIHEVEGFCRLPRVTSDANPWPAGGRLCICRSCGTAQKAVDASWLEEIAIIYRDYDIYHQAGGEEQPIFGPAGPAPRSSLISDLIDRHLRLPDDAAVLDFGCGSGAALRTFSLRHPRWRLYGSELSDRSLERLRALPNFRELFTGPPDRIEGRFDLVTMIHSLEHIIEPATTLGALTRLLGDHGSLLIEVPDCRATPYDLAIADHLTHFTADNLRFLMNRCGLETEFESRTELPKELTWIGRVGRKAGAGERPKAPVENARTLTHIAWLQAQIEEAMRLAATTRHFGIFGTSISATWLAGPLIDRVAFFVDEDPGRIGRTHMGKPILPPEGAPAESDVYAPLIPATARNVAARWKGSARFHCPPEIAA